MAQIDPQDFIKELRFDIKEKDALKAKLVLSHLDKVDTATQKMALFELSRAEDQFAIPLIVEVLVRKPDLADAFPALKETLYAKALDHPQTFIDLLMREMNREVRLVLVAVAAEIRLEEALPAIMGILNEEHDEKILQRAIVALGQIGDPSVTTALSEYLYSNHVELVIAAIEALGQLGTPTAFKRLSEKLDDDPDLDLMILNVFQQSPGPEALEKLNGCLSSHHAHIRNAAKQILIQLGSRAVPSLMENLTQDDPDLCIHTLNVLGDIGDEAAIPAIRKLLFNEPKDANVRFAAYEVLGRLPVQKGAITLAAGLHDAVPNVRTAAATAIDNNYAPVLAAGLKNMVRETSEETDQIAQAVIEGECDRIFLGLVEAPAFQETILHMLKVDAHAAIRDHFEVLLRENGQAELADRLGSGAAEAASQKDALTVFAVDDSRMILNIYRSVLHKLGLAPELFELPAEAIERVREMRPDVILTDLNMPEISGIELTRQVRQWFSAEQMPIVMVTTQNESQDNEAAIAAGVNRILHKPFTETTIGQALASVGVAVANG
ncbi:MAG: HEAT repeat domain-containing protein [Desulfosarcinaceae bacterium]|nr:HEAT repeat domain-containing protein [Desulfosarcinaceae bacterium]